MVLFAEVISASRQARKLRGGVKQSWSCVPRHAEAGGTSAWAGDVVDVVGDRLSSAGTCAQGGSDPEPLRSEGEGVRESEEDSSD